VVPPVVTYEENEEEEGGKLRFDLVLTTKLDSIIYVVDEHVNTADRGFLPLIDDVSKIEGFIQVRVEEANILEKKASVAIGARGPRCSCIAGPSLIA
jgi:hypothetical protein